MRCQKPNFIDTVIGLIFDGRMQNTEPEFKFFGPGPNSRGDVHLIGPPVAFYQIKDGMVMDYMEDG